MYLVVYKLKDLKLKNKKFTNKSLAMKKFKALSRENALSVSLYHKTALLNFFGANSHFTKMNEVPLGLPEIENGTWKKRGVCQASTYARTPRI